MGSGLLIALLLPLYKRRYGGACAGLAVWAMLVFILFMFGELPGDPTALIRPWQRVLMLVILGGMAVGFATSATDRARGRPSDASP